MTNTPTPTRTGTRGTVRRDRWRCAAGLLAAALGLAVCGASAAAAAATSSTGATGAATAGSIQLTRPASAVAAAGRLLPGALPGGGGSATPSPSPSPVRSAPVRVTPTPPPGGIQIGPVLPTPTTPAAPGATVGTTGQGSPGLFDITGHITAAINDWFKGLVTSALTPILALLGHTLLATPDLTGQGRVAGLWQLMAGTADSLLVLLVLAGGAIVMSYETLQTRTAAKDIAPRIVVAAVAANASLALCGLAISLADALSEAVLGGGVSAGSAGSLLTELLVGSLAGGGIFLVLLGGVVAVLAVVLLATYVIRLALLVILVVAAPLALVCHALPQTEGVARLWWRAFGGCLAVQLGQSLVLVTALRVFLGSGGQASLGLGVTGGLVNLLVAACLCWVLVRIPSWVGRAVFGGGHGGGVGRAAKNVLLYKAAGALKAGMWAVGA